MKRKNNEFKKDDILTNVMDLFGNLHQRVRVISNFVNTITGEDIDTKERWVFHKIDLGMRSKCKVGYTGTKGKGFNLAASHRLKYTHADLQRQEGCRYGN